MPLTLVTGPANAEKARVVLDGYRAALRARGPILVVPTFADVERYRARARRATGVVFGARVVRFARLRRARSRAAAASAGGRSGGSRASASPPPRSPRRRSTSLAALGRARRASRAALLRLVDELEEGRVDAAAVHAGAARVGGGDAGARAYADELAALYSRLPPRARAPRPHRRAAASRRRARRAARGPGALGRDARLRLRLRRPARRCSATRSQTLAATGAEVTLSLDLRARPLAFAGPRDDVRRARTAADAHVELEARAEHYAPAARAALHHLERGLFEPPDDGALFDARPGRPRRRGHAAARAAASARSSSSSPRRSRG